jgi:hypothetical protein
MKNPIQAAWVHAISWTAAVVALGATLVVGPSSARAQCLGDCDGNGEVAVTELIVMVNIALGTVPCCATCEAADPNHTGEVLVTQIVSAVNNALNGCSSPICGDGVTTAPEACDPGSVCIGGANAGTVCTKETDCQGEGICDTFGQAGTAGTVVRKVCSTNTECGGAACIHCKRFAQNGCANNCTAEALTTTTLVPGVVSDDGLSIVSGSGAVVHGDTLTIPLPLVGTTNLRAGGAGATGIIPLSQRVDDTHLDRIPVSTLACACVRGSEFKTCGGTQFEPDGNTVSTECTDDASLCTGKKPCTAVAGKGNAGEGAIGCGSTGLPSVNYSIVQDSGGASGVSLPAVFTAGVGGPAGAQIIATGSAIGTVVGTCTNVLVPIPAPYGPDNEYCTDDDPMDRVARGIPSIQTLVTGTASSEVKNANFTDDNNIGPFSATGHSLTCEMLAAGQTTGAAQAGAFTSLNQPSTGDIAVANVFVAQ